VTGAGSIGRQPQNRAPIKNIFFRHKMRNYAKYLEFS
jgi:hypothetical protein